MVARPPGQTHDELDANPGPAPRLRTRAARWTAGHPLLTSVVVVIVCVGVSFALAPHLTTKAGETLRSSAIALVFVALIGGLVKILLDDFQRVRARRAEQARFVSAVLADLKGVYDRVERARVVIKAHESAKTYGDEMRALIDARVQLRNVTRALEAGTSGITPERERRICTAVETMEKYLATLTDEFACKYKQISNAQRIYEARVVNLLKTASETTQLPDNAPWKAIRVLDHLSDFIDGGTYSTLFEKPLDDASHRLRNELRVLLGGTQPATSAIEHDATPRAEHPTTLGNRKS